MGKHFTVQAHSMDMNSRSITASNKRHYTVANAMIPAHYQQYIDALSDESIQDNGRGAPEFQPEHQAGKAYLTVKNYSQFDGLSKEIHQQASDVSGENSKRTIFRLAGPMGQGLGAEQQGIHVAFCAGTGVLAFIDLVALIVRHQRFWPSEEDTPKDDFKLFMFNRVRQGEYVAQELLEKANQKCSMFEYAVQVSSQGERSQHWTTESILEQLTAVQQQGKIAKVWVCGTPSMSQTFEECFKKHPQDFKIQIL